jgi:hypothetical protein
LRNYEQIEANAIHSVLCSDHNREVVLEEEAT